MHNRPLDSLRFEDKTRSSVHGPAGTDLKVVVVDDDTWKNLMGVVAIGPGIHDVLIRHQSRLCGDYPGPCNCNNPAIHDGH